LIGPKYEAKPAIMMGLFEIVAIALCICDRLTYYPPLVAMVPMPLGATPEDI